MGLVVYFSTVLTDMKSDLTTDPRLLTAATIATAMKDAITAYSIDVAPELALRNAKMLGIESSRENLRKIVEKKM